MPAIFLRQPLSSLTGIIPAIAFLILGGCSAESGSSPPADEPLAKSYRTNAQVEALEYVDPYMWVGLMNGIVRHDTRTEKEITTYTNWSTNNGIMSNGIYALKGDSKGNMWVGTYGGGLSRFDGQDWTLFTPYGAGKASYGPDWVAYQPGEGLGDLWVYDIAFANDGTGWIATWKGASRFDGKSFHTYGEADGLADKWVYAITFDRDGTHADGIGRVLEGDQNPQIETYGTQSEHHATAVKDFTKPNPNYILAAATDERNRKWFGTWGAGLSVFDGRSWKTYTTQDGLGGNWVNVLAVDSYGRIWAGTNGGLSLFDGRTWRNYAETDGLLDRRVYAIEFDRKGSVWAGTKAGVSRLALPVPSFWQSLRNRLGL